MKIIDVSALQECAQSRGIDTSHMDREIRNVALALANAVSAELFDCSNQPDFGGYCASLRATYDGVLCPDDIDSADPHGDWKN
jgi:hypothetical protein